MRPPPVGGGYKRRKRRPLVDSRSFNEAAARGRRILADTDRLQGLDTTLQ